MGRHLAPQTALVLVALLVGVGAGVAAASLKRIVKFLNNLFMLGFTPSEPNYYLLAIPVAGIVLTMLFQYYVARGDVAHGTRIIETDISRSRYRLPVLMAFNPVIGCAVTMGFGASGGTEGPVALSGAAMGSVASKIFRFPAQWGRILFAIGAGAGIAAIFKSPMGGVLFVLELLSVRLLTGPVIALVLSCLVASSTAYVLSDFTFDISFTHPSHIEAQHLGWMAILGVVCGLYSLYYNAAKRYMAKIIIKFRSKWGAALFTGIILSVSVFIFPLFFGEGFGLIHDLVNGKMVSFTAGGLFAGSEGTIWIILAPAILLILKGPLVSASNCGGGVAGDFVPTFFAGCVAGYLFALSANTFFGASLPVWFFALTGMGCVMASSLKAPLMAVFILCESTDTYLYLFPYLIAIFLAWGVSISLPKLLKKTKP